MSRRTQYLKVSMMIVAGMLLLVTLSGCSSPTPNPSPYATSTPNVIPLLATPTAFGPPVDIDSPKNNSEVSYGMTVEGNARGIPSYETLWIIIFSYKVNRYYPQTGPIPIQSNGNWSMRAYAGTANLGTGEKFGIIAVLANADADRAFQDYMRTGQSAGDFPGMSSLPSGASVQKRITVTRTY